MTLHFDTATHTYTVDGVVVPSVTQVLAPLYDFSKIAPDVLEVARQKGVAVHHMIELDCAGDLDEEGLPDWMLPALANWRKFVAESGFVMTASEHRVFHKTYKYAGTLDLFGHMRAHPTIIDVKRSFAAGPVIGLQLAAYSSAYFGQGDGAAVKRYALKLCEVGPYKLEPFTDKGDFGVFLSLLTIHKYREKHSL